MTPKSELEELRGLLEKVEQSEGPDRELDLAIGKTLENVPANAQITGGARWYTLPDRRGLSMNDTLPHHTASLDAALALVERVLPGYKVDVRSDPRHNDFPDNPYTMVRLYERLDPRSIRKPHHGAVDRKDLNIALALIAALLKAKLSQLSEDSP